MQTHSVQGLLAHYHCNKINLKITLERYKNIEDCIICILNEKNSISDVNNLQCNEALKAFIKSYINIYRSLLCYFSLKLNEMTIPHHQEQIDYLHATAIGHIKVTKQQNLIEAVRKLCINLNHDMEQEKIKMPDIKTLHKQPAPVTTYYRAKKYPLRGVRFVEYPFYWAPVRQFTPRDTMPE